jgi:hypothetical protein
MPSHKGVILRPRIYCFYEGATAQKSFIQLEHGLRNAPLATNTTAIKVVRYQGTTPR